jgi:coenzyme PQQ precursor peptide PqqA
LQKLENLSINKPDTVSKSCETIREIEFRAQVPKGGEFMETVWIKPDFEEVAVNAECTAYASAR